MTESKQPPALSVVMIAYNEEECLESVTAELCAALEAASTVPSFEIVWVDDGSADQTLEIMRRLAAADPRLKVNTQENKGIGGALRLGFDAATGDFVTWVPADGQISPESVIKLFGHRDDALMTTTVYRHRDDPWYRLAISKTFNLIHYVRTGTVSKSGGNYIFARQAWAEHGPRGEDSMVLSAKFRQNLRDAGHPPAEIFIDARARQAGHSKVLNARAILRTLRSLTQMRR
jgi:dolichol-phosphate mannosyltransferase